MCLTPAQVTRDSLTCARAFPTIRASSEFPGSSVVERRTVNPLVGGSNPSRGANKINKLYYISTICLNDLSCLCSALRWKQYQVSEFAPARQREPFDASTLAIASRRKRLGRTQWSDIT